MMNKLKKSLKSDNDDTSTESTTAASSPITSSLSTNTSVAYLKVLKDYSLLMEYKRLKQQAPTGVYVLPSTDSLRRWYGIIFIRKGHYRGGIFKFVVMIPPAYPDEGPKVHFLSEIFHPLIHPDTGLLDISLQFPTWNSNQHYIVLLLCYIKKIFYKTEYWEVSRKDVPMMNPKAQQLWLKNKEEYLRLCEKNCAKSQTPEKLYSNAEDPKNSIQFERPRPVHDEAFRRIIAQEKEQGLAGSSYLDWFQDGVFKLDNGLGPVPTHLPPVTYQPPTQSSTTTTSSVTSSPPLLGPMSPMSPPANNKTTAASLTTPQ